MRIQKRHLAWALISGAILFIFLAGFRAERVERISVSGPVEKVDHKDKAVNVNGERVVLSPGTLIVNEEGKRLSLFDIKPQTQIAIEAVRHLNNRKIGVNKVIIKSSRRKP